MIFQLNALEERIIVGKTSSFNSRMKEERINFDFLRFFSTSSRPLQQYSAKIIAKLRVFPVVIFRFFIAMTKKIRVRQATRQSNRRGINDFA